MPLRLDASAPDFAAAFAAFLEAKRDFEEDVDVLLQFLDSFLFVF